MDAKDLGAFVVPEGDLENNYQKSGLIQVAKKQRLDVNYSLQKVHSVQQQQQGGGNRRKMPLVNRIL